MGQTAKAEEPSMEEILASIRRIIADDEGKVRPPEPPKPAPVAAPPQRPATPPPRPPEAVVPAPPPAPATSQDEIDAMLAGIDAAAKPNGKAPEDDGVADVLDLTESMTAPSPQPPVFRTIEGQSDVFFSEGEAESPAPPPRLEEPPRPVRMPVESALMSSSTSAAVDAAFNTLAHTVLTQNARTLEDLVTEMMRPMLKAWLDDNLPGLVERVVRAEIERVSRGRG
jgi:cell pole-organizing protein PopZ